MGRTKFWERLERERERLEKLGVSKWRERKIDGLDSLFPTRAVVDGKRVVIFNSNDYLGLRTREELKQAEREASQRYGCGPGAVRFISGTTREHEKLEVAVAKFHRREAAIGFSSAFAANLGTIMALAKGQSKDSLISASVLVCSDELNHRSIIEGIRVANLPGEQRQIYEHLNYAALERILEENAGKFERALVVSDGVFSMLGEMADVAKLRKIADKWDEAYEQGVMLMVDDCHGIGVSGKGGRGVEEEFGAQADALVGTLGKAFGVDGGYVVGNRVLIDYLREAAATYIYSNPLPAGAAAAAKAAVELVDGPEGEKLVKKLREKIEFFKRLIQETGLKMAAESAHAIQPLWVGEVEKAKKLTEELFEEGYWVTPITYPVVPKGRDEIRLQINATHTEEEMQGLVREIAKRI